MPIIITGKDREKEAELMKKLVCDYSGLIHSATYSPNIQNISATVPQMYIGLFEDLPDHLRLTGNTLKNLGRVTANEVASQTHRARAVESAYLNQLFTMGRAKKERQGRNVYFRVETEKK